MITITAKINKWNPEPEIISRAAAIIRSGGLVSFPTETVYGLGADALNAHAASKIYTAKGRPSDNPLILHVSSYEQSESLVYMNDTAAKLIHEFWPSPLTLVLPAREIIPLKTRGGLDTAAIRMPDNPIALALIEASHTPIAAPSANISGRPSPTDYESVYQDMNGRIDMILDGGNTDIGIESTVIDVTNPKKILLLRPGGISVHAIESVIDIHVELPDDNSKRKSPGTRYRHYAPNIPVKIWKRDEKFPECEINSTGYMGLHEPEYKCKERIIFDDVKNYTRGLFAGFRRFESEGLSCIIAEWPDDDSGTGAGLQDRIRRASCV